jgi:monovalent cation/hydrogen antiporter
VRDCVGVERSTIPEHRQEIIIQKKIAKACLEFLDAKYGREQAHNEHLNNLRARLQIDLTLFNQVLEGIGEAKESSFTNYQDIYLELLEQQRRLLNEMNRLAEFDEELIRKYLSLIDVEEFKFREKRIQEAAPIT